MKVFRLSLLLLDINIFHCKNNKLLFNDSVVSVILAVISKIIINCETVKMILEHTKLMCLYIYIYKAKTLR